MPNWEDNWELDVSFKTKSGGQGSVNRLLRKSDRTYAALKTLHETNKNDSERRERFCREASALKAVAGPGVPSVLEHNLNQKSDKEETLYLILEWIDGDTLTSRLNKGSLPISEALSLTKDLLEILKRCHDKGVLHRDIKPDNIILSDDNKPFLVDFGIAYCKEENSQFQTNLGQELGNRFFRIPDYAAGREKRDPRADLTMIAGVLFFLCTKTSPRILADEEIKPPHRALSDKLAFLKDDPLLDSLMRIFDIAFKASVDLRFQTAVDFIRAIDNVLFPSDQALQVNDLDLSLAKYKELLDREIIKEWMEIENAILEISRKLEFGLKGLADSNKLKSIHNSGFTYVSVPGKKVDFSYRLCRQNVFQPFVQLIHSVELVGEKRSHVTASYLIDGSPAEEYYKGLSADLIGLEKATQFHKERIFSKCLTMLGEKIEATF